MTYPSKTAAPSTGRAVKTCYDAAGRPTAVINVGTGAAYAAVGEYAAHGAVKQMTLGNGVVESWEYNLRQQPTQVQAVKGGPLLRLSFDYGAAVHNNGNVLSQTIDHGGGAVVSQAYTYDALNRLKTALDTGGCQQTYVYDRYGNRALWAGAGQCIPGQLLTPQVAVDQPEAVEAIFPGNRWVGASHDPVGNQTQLGTWTLAYDGENRVKSSTVSGSTTTYAYDGEGRRVKKVTASGDTTVYVYDALGQLAAEYTTATEDWSGAQYLTADHLGSRRLATTDTPGQTDRCDYMPFGEELSPTVGNRPTACGASLSLKFTGKERDTESGLDYFGARYLSGGQGRFTSVDPIWVTKERLGDPQRLNLYAYARNNPLRYLDPDGMDITLGKCAVGTTQECFERVQQGLKQEDRAHVHLVQGDGKNGFKKGEWGVTVDADYNSDSKNFQTLQKLAGDRSATATIDVLKPNEKFDVRVTVSINRETGAEQTATMSTTPSEGGGFTGYTIYPQGQGVPGPWSPGNFTDVIVNSGRGWIPSTVHHELRHVLLGDFGRVAPYGKHGTGRVDQETTEAEKEAVKNQVEVIRNQR